MSKDYRYMSAHDRFIFMCEQYDSIADELIRLREENQRLRDMLFEKAVGEEE